MKKNKILVTGGAGYIGSVLVRQLLRDNNEVTVLDNLSFGGESIVELLNDSNFHFIKGDVRNIKDLEKAISDQDCVVHLAAIVGDPACAKKPDDARAINLEASKNVFQICNKKGVKRFVFASTCSNYGKMTDPSAYVDENSELRPVSLYAETKVAFEKFLLEQKNHSTTVPTILRFSTVYGLSPRPRFDLTVNEFTRELAMGKKLVIFGEKFWRPYCHVVDLARSVNIVLNSTDSKVAFEVFNVGDTSENFQKETIVKEILKQIPDGVVEYVQKNEDPRDYRVSFAKISNELDFKVTKRLPDGVTQIIQSIKDGIFKNPTDQKYSNV